MITINILINDKTILTRSARNTGKFTSDGKSIYNVDTGAIIHHTRNDGAVELAKKLLDTIIEP